MSYAPKRPKISQSTRGRILQREGGCCYLCGLPIIGNDFDADHELARELGGLDDESNLRPAHRACHHEKSRRDIALIAKGNRIRQKISGLDPIRRKPKPKMRSRSTFQKGGKIQSRPFHVKQSRKK